MAIFRRRACLTNTAFILLLTVFLVFLDELLAPKKHIPKWEQKPGIIEESLKNAFGGSNRQSAIKRKSPFTRMKVKLGKFQPVKTHMRLPGRYNGQRRNDSSNFISVADSPGNQGEMGRPVYILSRLNETEQTQLDQGWKDHGFNVLASDKMSVSRKLKESRTTWCTKRVQWGPLSTASVIIYFNNEAWSTLLRTVHSVINRSPNTTEIILVDDRSTEKKLGSPLDNYMARFQQVKIVRMDHRAGAVHCRIAGARHATGKILVFVDSSSEVTVGWLQPLLYRISRQRATVASPVVDLIHPDTFEYSHKADSQILVTGFDWDLGLSSMAISERERKLRTHPSAPIATPVIPGSTFAIDRELFQLRGFYDDELDGEGGAQLELSFKTWMCGGRIEIVPCSHVGVVVRRDMSSMIDPSADLRNKVRIAEVWMDKYKNSFYRVANVARNLPSFGDVSPRRALRQRLKCRSFHWYLSNIYPEFPAPEDALAHGEIRNKMTNLCLDSPRMLDPRNQEIQLHTCTTPTGGASQFWMLTKTGEIRREHTCLDFFGSGVVQELCHGMKGNQWWSYEPYTGLLRHASNTCMSVGSGDKLEIAACEFNNPRQAWTIENYNADRLL